MISTPQHCNRLPECIGSHSSDRDAVIVRCTGEGRKYRGAVLATRMAPGYLPGGGTMPLTPTQRKHLEARLLEERTRVVDALARYNRATRDMVEQEPGDRGTDTADQERDVVNAARETAELAEIDAALERLYKRPEEYGRCERSGKPIPFKRLDLVPWTRTCD